MELKTVFGKWWGEECGLLASNPFAEVVPPKLDEGEARIITPDERDALFRWLANEEIHAAHTELIGMLDALVQRAQAANVGAPKGTSTFGFNIGGGGVFDPAGNYFNGFIEDVAVFNKALSPDQLRSDSGLLPLRPFVVRLSSSCPHLGWYRRVCERLCGPVATALPAPSG